MPFVHAFAARSSPSIVVGGRSLSLLPIDAFPDTTPVQVQINTTAAYGFNPPLSEMVTVVNGNVDGAKITGWFSHPACSLVVHGDVTNISAHPS